MAVNIRTSTLVWLAIGVGMLAVAAWLTDTVTRLAPDQIATRTFSPDKAPFQMAAVFTAKPVDPYTGFDYSVDYTESPRSGQAEITFGVLPADDPIILLSTRSETPTCFLIDHFFAPAPPATEALTVRTLSDPEIKQVVHEIRPVWPDPGASEQFVRCRLPSMAHDESFTRRAADFLFDTRRPPDALDHSPVPRLLYRFSGLSEARDLGFRGGIETEDEREARDTSRFLDAGRIMSVHWEQSGRQSLRDTLLIVIGTLIGIGVTVVIEAAKPYVELLDRPRRPLAADLAALPQETPAQPPTLPGPPPAT